MLLWMLASVFALQVVAYGAGVGACIYVGLVREKPVCEDLGTKMQSMFDSAATTVLALLGGAGLRKD